eukprot:SAG22_NODE_520_length_9508_cov_1.914869_2_plen_124_part_00
MAADVAAVGSAMLVITDGDAAAGAALAERLGMELFGFRGTTRPAYLAPAEAVAAAMALPKGADCKPAVVADVWDNPGGGTAGDGTVLLSMLLEAGADAVGYSSVWDPQAGDRQTDRTERHCLR